ncbi:hypothetical protein [Psychromonas sp. SA13A]|uniref:hypothetical protein n=1 Tax=Psychromonas sp. SA13A TaxID=2686346 RepID=UPI001407C8A5|nr:hypothetical protein [Psychromonas sp. SA13A]
MRYKRSLLVGSENAPVSVSFPPFSSDKRKTCRQQGETTVHKNQAATKSAEEPTPNQPHQKNYLFHTDHIVDK